MKSILFVFALLSATGATAREIGHTEKCTLTRYINGRPSGWTGTYTINTFEDRARMQEAASPHGVCRLSDPNWTCQVTCERIARRNCSCVAGGYSLHQNGWKNHIVYLKNDQGEYVQDFESYLLWQARAACEAARIIKCSRN